MKMASIKKYSLNTLNFTPLYSDLRFDPIFTILIYSRKNIYLEVNINFEITRAIKKILGPLGIIDDHFISQLGLFQSNIFDMI